MMLKSKAGKFAITFILLFLAFYYFNIGFLSITSPLSKNYIPFIADNFNYIRWLRHILLFTTSFFLHCAGFATVSNDFELRVAGHGGIHMAYDCLGLGVISFFTAFVIAYPIKLKRKLLFLLLGILTIQLLNILRLALIALYWGQKAQHIIDHHIIFNTIIYVIIGIGLYFWVTADDKKKHGKN